jgi:hypothetical protein
MMPISLKLQQLPGIATWQAVNKDKEKYYGIA